MPTRPSCAAAASPRGGAGRAAEHRAPSRHAGQGIRRHVAHAAGRPPVDRRGQEPPCRRRLLLGAGQRHADVCCRTQGRLHVGADPPDAGAGAGGGCALPQDPRRPGPHLRAARRRGQAHGSGRAGRPRAGQPGPCAPVGRDAGAGAGHAGAGAVGRLPRAGGAAHGAVGWALFAAGAALGVGPPPTCRTGTAAAQAAQRDRLRGLQRQRAAALSSAAMPRRACSGAC